MKYYLSSLSYPYRGYGFMYSLAAIFILLCIFLTKFALGVGFPAMLCLTAYLGVFFLKIVQSSASGKETLCDIPSFENFFDSMMKPVFRLVALALVCLAMPVAALMTLEGKTALIISLLLLLPSLFYLPVAFIRISIMESTAGLSPAGCFDTIREIPVPYLILVACSLPVWGLLFISPFSIMFDLYTLPLQYYLICVYLNIMGKFYIKYEDHFDLQLFISR